MNEADQILSVTYTFVQNCPMCISLAAMSKLYKIASHPCLLQVDHCESGQDAKKKLEFAKAALTPDILRELPGGTHWKSDGIMDDHIALSGKMKSLDYLLRKYLKRRNRVLLFSYSTATLDMIQNHIKVSAPISLSKHLPETISNESHHSNSVPRVPAMNRPERS